MRFLHVLLALSVVLVWGFNFVAIKVGIQEMPPLFLCTLRFVLTSLPVFFVPFPATTLKNVLLYGWFLFALPLAFLFTGMHLGVTPGLASLLAQGQVFFSIAFGIIFLGEKLHLMQVLGAIVAFSGIALIGMNTGGTVSLTGVILLIAYAASWGFGNLISKKIGHVNMISIVAWASLMAWPPLLVASYLFEGPDLILSSLKNLSWPAVGSLLYLAYLATSYAFGIWSWLLHHYCMKTVTPFTLLVPIIAIGSSVWLFDEELQSWKILAAMLVLAGLCINLLGSYLFPKKR